MKNKNIILYVNPKEYKSLEKTYILNMKSSDNKIKECVNIDLLFIQYQTHKEDNNKVRYKLEFVIRKPLSLKFENEDYKTELEKQIRI